MRYFIYSIDFHSHFWQFKASANRDNAAGGLLQPRNRAGAAQTLAVFPFRPLTATDRNESLELGMAETLITRLNDSRLLVKPLSAVRRYANPGGDAVAAGRELNVDAVL
ncbi:MAG TPA: hypothetical protein VFY27_00995 [Woeseiaceae bacterium]|nr:hypothetical protein [Woeseiaceae bacterium]